MLSVVSLAGGGWKDPLRHIQHKLSAEKVYLPSPLDLVPARPRNHISLCRIMIFALVLFAFFTVTIIFILIRVLLLFILFIAELFHTDSKG